MSTLPISHQPAESSYPLTPLQQGMLYHALSEPNSGADIEQLVISFPEWIEPTRVRAAWDRLMSRHAVLRTSFRWENTEGEPLQEVWPDVSVPVHLCDALETDPEGGFQRWLDEDRRRGFRMDQAPLQRLTLHRFPGRISKLVWTFHHALLDGRSFTLLLEEFFRFLDTPTAAAPVVSRPFHDFIKWQRSRDLPHAEPFWREHLRGFRAPNDLAIAGLNGSNDERKHALAHRVLSKNLTTGLRELAAAQGVTLNTIVQGAWALLLSRYSREDDVVFGATRACRHSSIEGADRIVGLLINTVPLRTQVKPETPLGDWLRSLRKLWIDLREHEHTPLAKIQSWSDVPSGTPLFHSLVVFENYDLTTRFHSKGGVFLDRKIELHEFTNLPICLAAYGGESLRLVAEYDQCRIDAPSIDRLLGHFGVILQGMAEAPESPLGKLPMLTADERKELTKGRNSGQRSFASPDTIVSRFELQAGLHPESLAASCEGSHLTYALLNSKANQLAHFLRSHGVGPDTLVGVCTERSLDLIVALLGILKAGGAYLPIDLAYPGERLAFMLEDAQAPFLLTQQHLLPRLPHHGARVLCLDDATLPLWSGPDHNPSPRSEADHLAYVIYTSGSTGKPKGVQITHRNVIRLFDSTEQWFHFNERDVWSLFHSYAFDFSVWEIWGALLYGGRVVVVPFAVSRSPQDFYKLLAAEKITVLNQTPSAFKQLSAAEESAPSALPLNLRLVIFGGEALEMESLRPWFKRHGDQSPRLVNMYGITETTVHVTYRPISKDDLARGSVIGEPIADLELYLLDSDLQPVPDGIPGEMFIGGGGLARGYLHRPDLTADRFIAHPFSSETGARLYRSGDLARRLSNGDLEYLGRIDQQVQLRGFRVELGEIESVLASHPQVREARVIMREDTPGEQRLAAYLLPSNCVMPGPTELREHLRRKLPDYMVPAAFVTLDKFPLTNNGKLDTKSLPAPSVDRTTLGSAYREPSTSSERILAKIWQDVLKLPKIGTSDNYFELGGDSILSIQIIGRARAAGLDLMPKHLFKNQTIAELAAVCATSPKTAAAPVPEPTSDRIVLTPIQRWFFAHRFANPNHWTQSFLFETKQPLDPVRLQAALESITLSHPALRLRFENGAPSVATAESSDLLQILSGSSIDTLTPQGSLDIARGPLLRGVLYPDAARFFLTIHHLAVDGVSWRVLLEDLEAAYLGRAVTPPTATFALWSRSLEDFAKSPQLAGEAAYWRAVLLDSPESVALPPDAAEVGANVESSVELVTLRLSDSETQALLRDVPATFRTRINAALLAALASAFRDLNGNNSLFLELEGHGREHVVGDLDTTRTVGWFTSIFPVSIRLPDSTEPEAILPAVQKQLDAIPSNGVGFGALQHLSSENLGDYRRPDIIFNHLGQFDQVTAGLELLRFASDEVAPWHGGKNQRTHALEINTLVIDGCLEIRIQASANLHRRSTIETLGSSFASHLRAIAGRARASQSPTVNEVWPLTPMQRLFYTVGAAKTNYPYDQWHARLVGPLDVPLLRKAWHQVVNRHSILRSVFPPDGSQQIQPEIDPAWKIRDGTPDEIGPLLESDRRTPNDLASAPLCRFHLLRFSDTDHFFLWSLPDLQMDGWSWPIVFREVSQTYAALKSGRDAALPKPPPFTCYLNWLEKYDAAASLGFWRTNLAGITSPTPLPLDLIPRRHAQRRLARQSRSLTADATAQFMNKARERRITPGVLLQAAWAVLLGRCAATSDVVFGAAFSGRPADLPGVESIVGPFTNNLPVRLRVEPSTRVADFVASVQDHLFELDSHQFTSALDIHDSSGIAWKDRLFDSIVVFQNYEVGTDASLLDRDVRLHEFNGPIHTNLDLTLVVVPGTELQFTLIHETNRCSPGRAEELLRQVAETALALVNEPGLTLGDLQGRIPPLVTVSIPSAAPSSNFVAPTTPLERTIAAVWQKAFGLDRVGIDDNFFDLGGHSLLLIRVHARLCELLKRDFTLVTLFQHPTIASLAGHLDKSNVALKSPALVTSDASHGAKTGAVAVVGMALRVPGANTLDEFWQNLVSGKEAINSFSKDQLAPGERSDDPDYVPRRGVLKEPTFLDAQFFGIKPKEAEVIDPQQRLFLEAAHEALESAGVCPREWPGAIGVYAGVGKNYYYLNNVHHNTELRDLVGEECVNEGNEKDYIATRVAYKLDLTGPALNIHTACSTSLVAVCQAVSAINNGDCDMALAGGAAIRFPQERGYLYEEGSIHSPDGHCRAFDASAAGTVFSNGLGVVVLKRLEDAERDGDTIYSVIKGVGLNNDGAGKVSFTAPSVDGQAAAITKAIRMAGVSPESISYVEAHGTGTPLGDPIEVAGLTQAFRSLGATRRNFCGLGSLKPSTGHLDAAAGVCGLIKASLALHHKQIPATLHFKSANAKLGLDDSPFRVIDRLTNWTSPAGIPRRAGVSALGVGGTNAHVILEEAPPVKSSPSTRAHQLLVLSAKTPEALETAKENIAAFLESHPQTNLADAAFTLQVGRQPHLHRAFVVAENATNAIEGWRSNPATQHQTSRDVPVALMFPGQGAQYPGMGAGLYANEPVYRKVVDRCAEILSPVIGLDLRTILFPDSGKEEQARMLLRETRFTQPAIFVTSYATAQLWAAWGIRPCAMLGHSVGEYVAATIAGVFRLEDALTLVARRAQLVQSLPEGAMLAVRLPEDEVQSLLPDDLDLAALNSRSLTVVAGPFAAIARFEEVLKQRGITAKRLPTSHAFHSRMMDPAVAPFEELFDGVVIEPPEIPFVSNVTGRWIKPEEATSPSYWAAHMRRAVRFSDALATLFADSSAALLEAGPGTSCTTFAKQHPDRDQDRAIAPTLLSPEADELASTLDALGRLWLGGVTIDWTKFHESNHERRRRIPLPTYPFERQNYCAPPIMVDKPSKTASALPVSRKPAFQALAPAPTVVPAAKVTRHDNLVAELRSQLHEISGTALNALEPSSSFLDLGFDSLFLTQASLVFKKRFGVKITFRQLMEEQSSIDALARYLDKQLPADQFAPAPTSTPSIAPQATVPTPTAGARTLEDRVANLEAIVEFLQAGSVQPSPLAPAQSAAPGNASVSSPIKVQHQNSNPDKKVAFGPFRAIEKGAGGALTKTQKIHLDDLIARYNQRTAGSKSHTQKHRHVLADPRAVAGFNPLWKDLVYPIVAHRSEGSKIWDVDENEYVDVTLGFGLGLFGHRPKFVTDAVKAQLDRGFEIGPSHPLAGEVAEMIREASGMDRVSFCNTGSEAVTAAIRVSRTVSGRDKIVMFTGAYHGIFDEVLVRPLVVNGELRSIPIAPGITNSAVQEIIVLEYGNPESLEIIRRHGHEIAAVLVETIQSRRPEFQPVDFLKELRAITLETETALVFDEVVTGFRAAPGGNQERFDIHADLVTYGKVVGGGLPIGVVAGSRKYMDALDGGFWQYGDDSFPEVGVTFFAGTFVRHPLALAAAKAVLTHLKQEGPALQQTLDARAEKLVADLNTIAQDWGVPVKITRFSSLYFFHFAPELKHASLFFVHMRLRGIHIWESRPSFISTAHSDADISRITTAFSETLAELQRGEFFPGRSAQPLTIEPAARAFPLTASQEEIFLSSKLSDSANLASIESITLRIEGRIDLDRLRRAVRELPARHESLRITFAPDGSCQTVTPNLHLEVPVIDLGAGGESGFHRVLQNETSTAFDLVRGPLFRAIIARISDTDHRVILSSHHSVCDGWSFDVLAGDLAALYRGEELPPATPFHIYARETEEFAKSNEFAETESLWRARFLQLPEPLALPADSTRPRVKSFRAGSYRNSLPPDLAEALQQFCRENRMTPYTVLLATYQVLLGRLTGQSDLIIGAPIAGQAASGHEGLCGHCVNFLPLRLTISQGATVKEHLAAVRSEVLDAMEHQHYTLGHLTRSLPYERDVEHPQLVSTTFTLEPEGAVRRFGEATATAEVNPKQFLSFDLSLFALAGTEGIRLFWVFNQDILSEPAIRRWSGHFEMLLRGILSASPATLLRQLPLLNDNERTTIVRDWNHRPASPLPTKTITTLFEEQATRNPDAIALALGDTRMTYGELSALGNGIAVRLRSLGVRHGDAVAIVTERSFEMIAALIGILRAGAAYVPIDPSYPADRIQWMLEDSRAPVVITPTVTQAPLSEGLPPGIKILDLSQVTEANVAPVLCESAPDDLAYIIYTSGSTGRPKGTLIPHAGVVRLVCGTDYASFGSDEVFLQAATVAFDASTFEIWGPLLNGGTLALLPPGAPTLEDIGHAIAHHGVTTLWLTAGLFQMMIEERPADLKPLRQLLAGGDVLPREQVATALKALPSTRIINGYGPTENTTFTCCHTITSLDLDRPSIPIGRPIAHTQVYILDSGGCPAPIGVPGELFIGGAGLAKGYLNQPELTKEKFVDNPFSNAAGAKLYRSGDLCRWLPDGTIEFLGRIDAQLKVRGYRIEPGEIERVLGKHKTVRHAIATVKGNNAGDKTLVAYVVPSNGAIDERALRKLLQDSLPDYMVPGAILSVKNFPVTANGKVDYRALPDPVTASRIPAKEARTAPETKAEQALSAIWQDVLKVTSPSCEDNFFEAGGHSLLGLKLFTRIQKSLGVTLPLATLFRAPTLGQLAAVIATNWPEPERSPTSLIEPARYANTLAKIKPDGDKTPICAIHGGDGGAMFYREVASRLPAGRPFYCIEAPSLLDRSVAINEITVEETATEYLRQLRSVQPEGPFLLAGYSFGGVAAWEMARQLREKGESVLAVVLFDTTNPQVEARNLYSFSERAAAHWQLNRHKTLMSRVASLTSRLASGMVSKWKHRAAVREARRRLGDGANVPDEIRVIQVREAHTRAFERYVPRPLDAPVILLRANTESDRCLYTSQLGWEGLTPAGITVLPIGGGHLEIFDEPHISNLVQQLATSLNPLP